MYSNAPQEVVDPLIYEGFVEELVEVLEIRDNSSELVVSNADLFVFERKGGRFRDSNLITFVCHM